MHHEKPRCFNTWDPKHLNFITKTEWDLTETVWDPQYENIKWYSKYETIKDTICDHNKQNGIVLQ